MKKLRNEPVLETKQVLTELICNCCGKTIDVEHTMGTDITEFKVHFGYGSRFDMSFWEMDICDDCLEKWTSTFKHKVDVVPYTFG